MSHADIVKKYGQSTQSMTKRERLLFALDQHKKGIEFNRQHGLTIPSTTGVDGIEIHGDFCYWPRMPPSVGGADLRRKGGDGMTDAMLAKLENVLDASRARLVTAETGYTQGELDDIEAALAAVRAERSAIKGR